MIREISIENFMSIRKKQVLSFEATKDKTSHELLTTPTTLNYFRIPSFGTLFSPVEFSAQGHSTSELLRTLLMSGCF